jgi:hypothetical protein
MIGGKLADVGGKKLRQHAFRPLQGIGLAEIANTHPRLLGGGCPPIPLWGVRCERFSVGVKKGGE